MECPRTPKKPPKTTTMVVLPAPPGVAEAAVVEARTPVIMCEGKELTNETREYLFGTC